MQSARDDGQQLLLTDGERARADVCTGRHSQMPAIPTGAARRPEPRKPTTSSGALTGGQKAALILGAVLVGPAVLKKIYDKPPEKVDLSSFNIVTHYDTPAIERMDSTVRIEFCSS